MSTPTYDPNALLDSLRNKLQAKNDAALSRALDIKPPMLSKMRHGRMPVSAGVLLRMHEVSGLPLSELRQHLGDRRAKHRASAARTKQALS